MTPVNLPQQPNRQTTHHSIGVGLNINTSHLVFKIRHYTAIQLHTQTFYVKKYFSYQPTLRVITNPCAKLRQSS